jgi:hypothetical protein
VVALIGRDAQFWRTFLEFNGIYAGMYGGVDHSLRQLDISIMVDADLGNDVGGISISYEAFAYTNIFTQNNLLFYFSVFPALL